jgi:hypothetical protein
MFYLLSTIFRCLLLCRKVTRSCTLHSNTFSHMASRYFSASKLILLAFFAQQTLADASPSCIAFGVDFQDGGSYFQNSLSNSDFTFVSQFEGSLSHTSFSIWRTLADVDAGCEPDVANNILIDDQGDQYECTDTNLTPSDTNELSTW